MTSDYADEIENARKRSGSDEAVITGQGTIDGHPIVLIASDFAFLAGSLGRRASLRVVETVARATALRLPILAIPRSGGTRMQEGTPAFVKMMDITRVIASHKAAGLLYLVYLRHPTTGGAFASWGSLGHIILAEPGAFVGFLGPRVVEALIGEAIAEGAQRSENLAKCGVIDAVVPVEQLPAECARILRLLRMVPENWRERTHPTKSPQGTDDAEDSIWTCVQFSRSSSRPSLRDLLEHAMDDVVELHGTSEGEDEPGIRVAICSAAEESFLLIGQDRSILDTQPLTPAGLRKARRGIRLADELGLPLFTVIDTPGVALNIQAEVGALAGEIARTLVDLQRVSVPRISLLLGQGCGGDALALLPADLVLATRNAWLAPLPPEGASAIVFRDRAHAADMAEMQQVGAQLLVRAGIVDTIIEEPADSNLDPITISRSIMNAVMYGFGHLHTQASRSYAEHR